MHSGSMGKKITKKKKKKDNRNNPLTPIQRVHVEMRHFDQKLFNIFHSILYRGLRSRTDYVHFGLK